MEKNPHHPLITRLLALLAIIQFTGCTLIVAGLGETARTEPRTEPGAYLTAVTENSEVVLFLDDGTQLAGTYLAPVRYTDEVYAEAYTTWHQHCEVEPPLPLLGESISTTQTDGTEIAGTLHGFEYGTVYLQQETRRHALLLTEVDAIISSNGRVYPGAFLHELTTDRDVPLYQDRRIENQEGITSFDMRRVNQVQIAGKNNKGTLVYAAMLDFALIVGLIYRSSAMDDWSMDGTF